MKRFLLLLVVFALCISPVFSQTVIFSEDFESGTPSTEWGLYRVAEEPILAIPMGSAPAALPNGGSFVGMIHDVDFIPDWYFMLIHHTREHNLMVFILNWLLILMEVIGSDYITIN